MIDSKETEPNPNSAIQRQTPAPRHWMGIDGCRGGWIIACLKDDHPAEIHFIEALRAFLKKAPKDTVILIDMILYKPMVPNPRPFDRFAKAQLGKWHSRVFPAPPQEALKAKDYPEACKHAFSLTGKKISKQCYNLFPKIRVANHPSIPQEQLIEYHPEIAFKQLNQNTVIEASKKTALGRTLRRQLIASHLPNNTLESLSPSLKTLPQKNLWQTDDCLDALALALVAKQGCYKDFYRSLDEAVAP